MVCRVVSGKIYVITSLQAKKNEICSNTLQNNKQPSPSFFHLLAIYFIIPLSHPSWVCAHHLGGLKWFWVACAYMTQCVLWEINVLTL